MCKVDQNILPDDAEFKGYQSMVVQEIIVKTDNVNIRKRFTTPTLKKGPRWGNYRQRLKEISDPE